MVPFLDSTFMRILFVGSRVCGFFVTAPGFSEVFVSVRVRLLLILSVSIVLTMGLDISLFPEGKVPFSIYIYEWVKGAFLGVLVRFVLEGVSFLGYLLNAQLSFSALSSSHMSHESQMILSSFLRFFFLTVFFVCDLHHLFLKGLKNSYVIFGDGTAFWVGDMTKKLLNTLSQSFFMAIQLSTPFLISSLIYYLILGFLNRFVPMLPVFFVGKPLEIFTLFLLLLFCLLRFMEFYPNFLCETLSFLNIER